MTSSDSGEVELEGGSRGIAHAVLAATTAVAVMGTLVASVAMLTAWGVITHGKDAPDEAAP